MMKKNIINLLSLFVWISGLCACEEKAILLEEETAVNITPLIERFHQALATVKEVDEGMESMMINIMDGSDILLYGEPTSDIDYAVLSFPTLRNNNLENWLSAYNGFVTTYNINSQFELWIRANWSGSMCDTTAIGKAIKDFKTDIPLPDSARIYLSNLQVKMASFLEAPFKDAEGRAALEMMAARTTLQQYLSTILDQLMQDFDTTGIGECIDISRSCGEIEKLPSWLAMTSIEGKNDRVEPFFRMLLEADSFEQQIMIVMASIELLPYYVTVPTMRYMLGSGHYSKYQFLLWYVWRTITQLEYYGRSRDSVIADALFNQYRKAAFLATIVHLDNNIKDKSSISNLVLLLGSGNIIRNGDCIFGNDANLDYMEFLSMRR